MFRKRMRCVGGAGAFLCCALALSAGVANADMPDVVFQITAQAGPISAEFDVLAEWGTYDPETQTWTWTLPEAYEFWGAGTFLGSLDEFDATIVQDPEVNLNFAVQAGGAATSFHIASALLSFDTIPSDVAEGQASAAFTLTDFDGTGTTLTGIGDTGGAYLAQYNGWAGDLFNGPQGTTFAEGITSMTAGSYETVVDELNVPETGFLPIGEDVYDMSSLVSFTLTAYDLASGTSHYEIVPEPGALVLLAFGGLALMGRRR